MLTLVEDKMVLLQEGLAAFGANVRPERATSFRMAFVMQSESVLGHEALAAELTEMRFRLLLRRRLNLDDGRLLGLLRLLLCNLNRWLLHHLLLDRGSLLSLLRLLRLVDLDLLVLLRVRRTLENLIDDFTG
jgi:hypothetical protein